MRRERVRSILGWVGRAKPQQPATSAPDAGAAESAHQAPQFPPAVESLMARLHLRLESRDKDTLMVRGVPADSRLFSKRRTNLMVKRIGDIGRSVVCVDEDLDYQGADRDLARAFAAGSRQAGWRVLTFGGSIPDDLMAALEFALNVLGAEGTAPAPPAARPVARMARPLASLAEDLTARIESGRDPVTLHRDEQIERAAGCVLSWTGRLPLILGRAGVGKTNLLCGISRALRMSRRRLPVYSVQLGAAMAGLLLDSERESLLRTMLRECREEGAVLALEQAEWAVLGVPRGLALVREALDEATCIIATTSPSHARLFCGEPLAARVETVSLSELCRTDTGHVLEALGSSISAHHEVGIGEDALEAVLAQSASIPGFLPGKAVALLDTAAARAGLAGASALSLLDVYLTASRMGNELTP